jgi:uncharacterized protein (TIGR02145 family)
MKNFTLRQILLLSVAFFSLQTNAQAPQKMCYQSVLRNSSNVLLAETQVGIKISVLQGGASGNAVYTETHTPTTNANGLVSLQIGTGDNQTGSFAGIDWANGSYFIKTETDPAGGTNYTITGTQELLSVPYAMYAKNGITTAQANAITTMQAQINSLLQARAYPVGSIFCASGATQVVDVTSPTTGKTWMDRNLGASQVATSSTDAAAYGDLYQWGRGSDGHQCRNSATTSTLSSTDQPGNRNFILAISANWRNPQNANLWQGVNGINNPCPSGYRIPTEPELEAERSSWSSNNSAGAFASPLKLPMAGYRIGSGGVFYEGSDAHYWSSSVSGADSRYFRFYSNNAGMRNDYPSSGGSVRCIKD